MNKAKLMFYSMSVAMLTPFVVGCDPFTTGAALAGSVLWWDVFLIPVRSFLGSTALGVVNGV